MQHRLALFLALTLASGAAAQRVLTTVYGTIPSGGLGTVVRAAGDVDRDGVGDFVVTEPTNANPAPHTSSPVRPALRSPLSAAGPVRACGDWARGRRHP